MPRGLSVQRLLDVFVCIVELLTALQLLQLASCGTIDTLIVRCILASSVIANARHMTAPQQTRRRFTCITHTLCLKKTIPPSNRR